VIQRLQQVIQPRRQVIPLLLPQKQLQQRRKPVVQHLNRPLLQQKHRQHHHHLLVIECIINFKFKRSILDYNCSAMFPDALDILNSTTGTNWTLYNKTVTATNSSISIIFGIQTDGDMYVMLDGISLKDVYNSSFELLRNPRFEDSIGNVTNWDLYCTQSCSPPSQGHVINNSSCFVSNCYIDGCNGGGTEYLVQSVASANYGQNLSLAFWYKFEKYSAGGWAQLSVTAA